MNIYSISNQDNWVLDMTQNKMNGVFLDLGCGNGIINNNTYKLESQFNWSGVCVDKNYSIWSECILNRTSVCLNYEIVASENMILNSGQTTINTIIDNYFNGSDIDYLSINLNCDTLDVIKSIDFDRFNIKLITLQHNRYKTFYNCIDSFHYFLLSKNFERKFIDVTGVVEGNEKFNQPYEDWFYNKSYFD